MAEIVLTEEQAAIYRQANEPVKVRDTNGIMLGTLDPGLTPEFIAEMKRRAKAPGPRYTGAHVQRMLQFLDKAWEREGPFDASRMRELLVQFRAQDPECQPGK
jgi:hypothetical protein